MQSPTRVSTRHAYEISGRVLINGNDIGIEVVSVSIGRDIPTGVPGDRGGFSSAEATVIADLSAPATSQTPTPWTREASWPPRPSDRVELWLSDDGGETEWQQIVGSVSSPRGSTDSPRVEFTIVDRYSGLKKPTRIPALSNVMPPLTDANQWQYTGMHPIFLADRAMRAAGRYVTPSMMYGCFISVPFMGSTWPQRGTLRTSFRRNPDDVASAHPSFTPVSYGMAARNVEITATPHDWSGADLRFNSPMEIVQELPEIDGSTYIFVIFGDGQLSVAISNTQVFARYISRTGAVRDIASAPRNRRDRVCVRFIRSGSALAARIRFADRGGGNLSDISDGQVTINSGDLDGDITRVRAYADGTMGAFQAGYPDTAWSRLSSTPNATAHLSNFTTPLIGVPEQIDVDAADLLSQLSDAEFASWWIDENDIFQWWDRWRLAGRSSAATLTATDHIKKLKWRHRGSTASQVHVEYKTAHKVQRWRTNLTLWQGGSQTIEAGDDEEVIVTTPTDEVWLGVDYANPHSYVIDVGNWWAINRGIRTVLGGIAINSDGDERRTNSILSSIRRITDTAYAIRTQITALGDDESVSLQFPSDGSADANLWGRWRGEKLPLLRGQGKVLFEDASLTSTTTGDAWNPDYTHNVGWLIQSATPARRVADYIAGHTANPGYMVEGVEIMPVFNLQVGDTITLDDPIVIGVAVRGIVTSNNISADFGSGECSQQIDLRVLSVTADGVTWRDFGRASGDRTWTQFGSLRSGHSWTDFGDNPLRGL